VDGKLPFDVGYALKGNLNHSDQIPLRARALHSCLTIMKLTSFF